MLAPQGRIILSQANGSSYQVTGSPVVLEHETSLQELDGYKAFSWEDRSARRCSYCNVYKARAQYASDCITQCIRCSERRRELRLAKRSKVCVTTEEGERMRFCTSCGGYRSESEFGLHAKYRTCFKCRVKAKDQRTGSLLSARRVLLHPEASAQHSGYRADASPCILAMSDGAAKSMKPAQGQGQNVLKSIQACDEYVLDPLELEVMGMVSRGSEPIGLPHHSP